MTMKRHPPNHSNCLLFIILEPNMRTESELGPILASQPRLWASCWNFHQQPPSAPARNEEMITDSVRDCQFHWCGLPSLKVCNEALLYSESTPSWYPSQSEKDVWSSSSQTLMCIWMPWGSCWNAHSDSEGLEQDLKSCNSSQLPGDTCLLVPGPHFEKPEEEQSFSGLGYG